MEQIQLPDNFLTENENIYLERNEIHRRLRDFTRQQLRPLIPANKGTFFYRQSGATDINRLNTPHMEFLMALLDYDNMIEHEAAYKCTMYYNSVGLTNVPNVVLQNLTQTDYSIQIITVNRGSNFIKEIDSIHELRNFGLVLQRSNQHRIRVFQPNAQQVVIYTNVYDVNIGLKIVTMLPLFFPEIYNHLTTELKEAILAATHGNIETFNVMINKWFTKTNPLENAIIKNIKTLLVSNIDARKNILLNHKINIEQTLENLERQHIQQSELLQNYERELSYILNNSINTEEAEQDLLDYLKTNKSIINFNIVPNKLNLQVYTPLKYINIDELKDLYLEEHRTAIDATMKKFFTETFIEEKYEIYTNSAVTLDVLTKDVTTVNTFSQNILTHPHIMRHSCWGDNRLLIKKALKDNDIQQAIAQVIATAQGLNVVDSTVMRSFKSMLHANTQPNIKIVETGQFISYQEYEDLIEEELGNETD